MFNSKFTHDASDQLSERTLSRFPTMAFKGYVKLRRCQYSVVMNLMVVEDQKSPNKKKHTHQSQRSENNPATSISWK